MMAYYSMPSLSVKKVNADALGAGQGTGIYSFFVFPQFSVFCHFFPVRLKQNGESDPYIL
jgi:hypothetical protein